MDFKNIFRETIFLGEGTQYVEKVEASSRRLKDFFEKAFSEFGIPKFCIVLGTSGPKGLLTSLQSKKVVEYSQLGFPISKAKGHAPDRQGGPEAKAHYGLLAGVPVLICVGRIHYYECRDMDLVTLMVRSICLLGIKDFIITNASGSLFKEIKRNGPAVVGGGSFSPGSAIEVGKIVKVTDFINKMGDNPLIGEEDYFHSFVDPNKVLDLDFLKHCNLEYKTIVYIAVSGRNFETKAESKEFAEHGHLMGMSSVPELLAVAQQGGRVLLLSLVTNKVISDYSSSKEITHEDNLSIVKSKDKEFSKIIIDFVSSFK